MKSSNRCEHAVLNPTDQAVGLADEEETNQV